MSIEKVREYMAGLGIADRIREVDVSSATVELAAKALGCEERRIAKTLSFHVGDRVVLIVAAGQLGQSRRVVLVAQSRTGCRLRRALDVPQRHRAVDAGCGKQLPRRAPRRRHHLGAVPRQLRHAVEPSSGGLCGTAPQPHRAVRRRRSH